MAAAGTGRGAAEDNGARGCGKMVDGDGRTVEVEGAAVAEAKKAPLAALVVVVVVIDEVGKARPGGGAEGPTRGEIDPGVGKEG